MVQLIQINLDILTLVWYNYTITTTNRRFTMTNSTPTLHDQLDAWKGKVTEDQLLDALSFALSNLETDPVISRKAYKMRLDNIISTDEYNPVKTRTGKPSNKRMNNDKWVNQIPKHCIPTCLMMVDDIFKMLESNTGFDGINGHNLRNRITELFINLRQYKLDYDHFQKIRHYILKTLDSYGQVDLMLKVSKFDS